MSSMINVLVCDDSALMRRSISKIIESDRRLHVVATARDGNDSVKKARSLQPDVVTMDINMPGMDGISAMQIIVDEKIAPVIMVSSLTEEGAVATFESLALGAFDYVAKPGGTVSCNMEKAAREIIDKIKAATKKGTTGRLQKHKAGRPKKKAMAARTKRLKVPRKTHLSARIKGTKSPGFKAVAMGISTGGPKTIMEVLPLLPADLPAAVFLVQHMPKAFTASFAKRIDASSPMRCILARAGLEVETGVIYLAHGGQHMTLYKKPSGEVVIRTPRRPEHTFMPSVDIMMTSVLDTFGADTVGVLMTGMGDDGADTMVDINNTGGQTIVESDETAIVFGMPQAAINRGGAAVVVPSWDIAEEIVLAVEGVK